MLEQTQDDDVVIERVAALDVGKAEVVCCVRVPGGDGGRRLQEVRTWTTMTRSLSAMGDWLHGLGVTRVVMEATSDYWKPPFYLLEAAGFEVWSRGPTTTNTGPAAPLTTKPSGHSRTGSSASSTAAYAPTAATTNTAPGTKTNKPPPDPPGTSHLRDSSCPAHPAGAQPRSTRGPNPTLHTEA